MEPLPADGLVAGAVAGAAGDVVAVSHKSELVVVSPVSSSSLKSSSSNWSLFGN